MEHHETPRIRRPEQGAETTTKKNKDDEKKHTPQPTTKKPLYHD